MCGQVGIVFGRKRRRTAELDRLVEVFVHLLLHSESRGPHASGLAWLKTDGSNRIVKQPLPARELIYEEAFLDALAEVDAATTVLMGHTRWRTRGDEANNANNHPIRAGRVIGTHNGTLYNADYLFRHLRLPRFAEVDSELIFRLADRCAAKGAIDLGRLAGSLAPCRGQMSAVLASRGDPGTITLLKGNKPLHLRSHRRYRVVLYASDAAFLDAALDGERGWHDIEVPPMTMLTFAHADPLAAETRPLTFIAQDRRGTLSAGVAA
jgi:amidophosphoribosyltransferase